MTCSRFTAATRPPAGPNWVYEIKHDGYRLTVRKAGDRVQIFTCRGTDWSNRFPKVVDGVARLRERAARRSTRNRSQTSAA
jgi:ATP-dependent DNA ligase